MAHPPGETEFYRIEGVIPSKQGLPNEGCPKLASCADDLIDSSLSVAPEAPPSEQNSNKEKKLPPISQFGKKLSEDKWAPAVHAPLDIMASIVPGSIKTGFDLAYGAAGSSAARIALSDWIMTPEGIITSVGAMIPLSIVASIAGYYSSSKEETAKYYYRTYQAGRDGVKGFISTAKGLKNAVSAAKLFWAVDLRYALLPAGIVLGVLTLGNRLWNRSMINERKDMMDQNKASIKALFNWGILEERDKLPTDKAELKALKNRYCIVPKSEDEIALDEDQRDENDPEQIPKAILLPHQRYHLYYINHLGETKRIEEKDIEQAEFDSLIKYYQKQKAQAEQQKKSIRPSLLEWHSVLKGGQAMQHFDSLSFYLSEQTKKTTQSEWLKSRAFISSVFGGLVDGLYMFMGLVALTALSPYSLVIVATVSTLFSALCVLTRVHEEKDYQRGLLVTQQKAELAIASREVDKTVAELNRLALKLAKLTREKIAEEHQLNELDDAERITALLQAAKEAIEKDIAVANDAAITALSKFNGVHKALHSTLDISSWDTLFVGLRHGVNAYVALLACVFAAATIGLLFFSVAMPEVVALCTVAAGLVMMAGFIAHAFSCAKAYKEHHKGIEAQLDLDEASPEATLKQFMFRGDGKKNLSGKKDIAYEALFENIPEIDASGDVEIETPDALYSMTVANLQMPAWHLMNWTDIIRSFFSGLSKGPKFVDFAMSYSDPGHHEVDNPLTAILFVLFAVVFAIVYLFRQIAKWHKELHDDHPMYGTTSETNNSGKHIPGENNDKLTEQDVPPLGKAGFRAEPLSQNPKTLYSSELHEDSINPTPKKRALSATFSEVPSDTTAFSEGKSLIDKPLPPFGEFKNSERQIPKTTSQQFLALDLASAAHEPIKISRHMSLNKFFPPVEEACNTADVPSKNSHITQGSRSVSCTFSSADINGTFAAV